LVVVVVVIPVRFLCLTGYTGFKEENLNSGYDASRQLPDLKECFAIGPYNPLAGTFACLAVSVSVSVVSVVLLLLGMPPVQWPAQEKIAKTWLEYYQAMEVRRFAVLFPLDFHFALFFISFHSAWPRASCEFLLCR
jgi:hypothetical protein